MQILPPASDLTLQVGHTVDDRHCRFPCRRAAPRLRPSPTSKTDQRRRVKDSTRHYGRHSRTRVAAWRDPRGNQTRSLASMADRPIVPRKRGGSSNDVKPTAQATPVKA
jgi:hypothetical protein